MVAGGLVGPALTRVRGIFRDLRLGTGLVNSTRDIYGSLAWSVHTDKYLCTYTCLHIGTGDSFSVVGPISDASILEIFRHGELGVSTRRLNFRDGYLLDFVGVVHYNLSVYGTDYICYCSNSPRSSSDFVHHLFLCFSVCCCSVERSHYSMPSSLARLVSLSLFGLKIRV